MKTKIRLRFHNELKSKEVYGRFFHILPAIEVCYNAHSTYSNGFMLCWLWFTIRVDFVKS